VQREFGTFAPTLDVFAIGALLARLRRLPTQPMAELPPNAWADPWCCLAFHCLAADPHLRFQSADQVLVFLREWLRLDVPPRDAIPLRTGLPSFSIAKFIITNREYAYFCRENNRLLPPHLRDGGRPTQNEEVSPWHRLNGPWLPVTHVASWMLRHTATG
jgi:hypothetical protein